MRPSPLARRLALAALALALVAAPFLPHGKMSPAGRVVTDPATGEKTFVHDSLVLRAAGAMLGQLAGILLLASLALSFRWPLPPRARTRAHVRLGVLILALSAAHVAVLLLDRSVRGWIPGALSLAALSAHGATGALKARLVGAWGAEGWRWAHRWSAWAALALVVEHVALASWHFGLARWFHEQGWP